MLQMYDICKKKKQIRACDQMSLMECTRNRRRSNVFEDARFWFCPNL